MKKIQGLNKDCNTLVMFKIMSNILTRLIFMHASFQEYALLKAKGQTLALFKFSFVLRVSKYFPVWSCIFRKLNRRND